MRRYVLIAALFCLISSCPARAQEAEGLKLPPPATTLMNLSATENQKVPQDLLVAGLRIEIDGKEPAALQSKVNEAMKKALDLVKLSPTVKAQTGAYSVYQYDPAPQPYPQDAEALRRRMVWKASQTLDLQAQDSDTLLKITGALQGTGFIMNGLSYTLSPEKYESVQNELLVRALAKLTAKADLAAKTLKKSGYDMLNVDLNPGGQLMYAQPMLAGAAMKEPAAPVAQAGESDVSLTVSARVLLKP